MKFAIKYVSFFLLVSLNLVAHGGVLPDADLIQNKIVSAIAQTPVTETAKVVLDARDYYFNFNNDLGIHGISIPRSHFVFDGNNAVIHVNVGLNNSNNCTVHTLNGALFQIIGLMQGNQQAGFEPSKIYSFPQPGSSTPRSVSVTFTSSPYYAFQQDLKTIGTQNGELGIEDVTFKNLTIQYEGNQACSKDWNTVAVYYANNITLENIKVVNSPATSFSVVSDRTAYYFNGQPQENDHPTSNVLLKHCSSERSLKEAYRFNANPVITQYDIKGVFLSNTIINSDPPGISATMLNSTASYSWTMDSTGTANSTERPNRPYHLIYLSSDAKGANTTFTTVSGTQSKNALLIDHGNFDSSGEIYAARGALNFSIINSDIWGGIYLYSYKVPNVVSNANIIGNYLNGYYAKPGFLLPDNATHEGIIRIDNIDGAKVIGNNIAGDRYGFINQISTTNNLVRSNYWTDGANGLIIQN